MAKLNIFVSLKAYSDSKPSNSPNFENFKWVREINGYSIAGAVSQMVDIPANSSLTLFTGANKKLVYLECSAQVQAAYNGASPETIKPVVVGSNTFPGINLKTSDISSLTVTNPSLTDAVTIFLATVE
jgi:hypothetical protein